MGEGGGGTKRKGEPLLHDAYDGKMECRKSDTSTV